MAAVASGKSGLKTRDVAKDHFSSGVKLNEPKFSRLVVRFLEGKSLLASDVQTGKSDPVCFVWCGPTDENPNLDNVADESSGISLTSVCPTTVDPIWNEDITFRLDVTDLTELIHLKCAIYCRDEDNIDGVVSYDDLGMIEVPIQEVIQKGKACANSIVMSAAWYKLNKSPGMRKVDGSLKLTISIIFGSDDEAAIHEQLEKSELLKSAPSSVTSRHSHSQSHSTAVQCQNLLKFTIDPTLIPPRPNTGDSPSISGSRAGSPFGRVSSARLRGNRRPASATRSMSSRTMDEEDGQSLGGGSISSSSFVPTVRRPTSAPSPSRKRIERGRSRNKFNGLSTAPAAPSIIEESDLEENSNNLIDRPIDNREEEFEEELHVVGPDQLRSAAMNAEIEEKNRFTNDRNNEALHDEMGVFERITGDAESDDKQNHLHKTSVNDQLRISVTHSPLPNHRDSQKMLEGAGDESLSQKIPEVLRNSTDGIHIDIEGRDMAELLAEAGEGPSAGDECGVLENLLTIGLDVVKDGIGDLEMTKFGDSMGTASKGVAKKLAKTAKALANHAADVGGAGKKINSMAGATVSVLQQNVQSLSDKIKVPVRNVSTEALGATGTATGAAIISESLEKTGAGIVDRTTEVQEAVGESANEVEAEHDLGSNVAKGIAPTEGDVALMVAPAAGDMLIDDDLLRKNEPESMHEPAMQPSPEEQLAISGAGTDGTNPAGQGTATAVVRALKEMTEQRKMMQQSLQDIARATQSGFSKLTNRMDALEKTMYTRTAPSVGEPGIDFHEMFSEDDDDVYGSAQRDDDDEYALRSDGKVVRRSERITASRTYPARSSRDRHRSGRKDRTREENVDHRSSSRNRASSQRHRTDDFESTRSPRSRSPDRDKSKKSGASSKRYGSSDLIRKAKLAAAATKASDKMPSSNSTAPLMGTSNLDMQLVMKGADGMKVSAPIASSPSTEQQSQMSPQKTNASPAGKGYEPGSEEERNTLFNRHIPPFDVNTSYSAESQRAPVLPQEATALSPVATSSGLGNPKPGSYYLPSSSGTVNQLMNKDFADILERGTLEDIGYMLESTAPKPEELSALVRNRLYDAVATLLLQKKHVERCLIWVLALTRSGQLNEMARHSKRDLQEALETASAEPSKRGLLASLLKSQVR